jgi:hypothetical protein
MPPSKAHAQSEWHRWFAWHPVIIWVEGKPARVWLRYLQRRLGTSRITGEPKWRYRPASAPALQSGRQAEGLPAPPLGFKNAVDRKHGPRH